MSNWDDSAHGTVASQDRKVKGPHAGDHEHEHEHSRAGESVASGFTGADDSRLGPESEIVEEAKSGKVKKKGGGKLLPKVLVGVMVLIVLGIVGFFSMRLAGIGNSKPVAKREVSRSSEFTRPALSADSRSTGTVGEVTRPTPAPLAAPAAVAPAAVGPITAVVAPVAAPVVSVAPSAGVVPALPAPPIAVAPAVQPVQPSLGPVTTQPAREDVASKQVQHLQAQVDRLQAELAAERQARPVGSVGSTRHAGAAGDGQEARKVATRTPRAKKGGAPKAEIITETAAEAGASPDIARLQLRGVYPRTGDAMQAWVLDGEKTRTLTRGDMINGAKVLRVEVDKVVTTAGVIH